MKELKKMDVKKENIIVAKTIDFALAIIQYTELLEKERKFVIARQLLKSGTSIGANVHEAQNAESKADFIHKVKIAAKGIRRNKILANVMQKIGKLPF